MSRISLEVLGVIGCVLRPEAAFRLCLSIRLGLSTHLFGPHPLPPLKQSAPDLARTAGALALLLVTLPPLFALLADMPLDLRAAIGL